MPCRIDRPVISNSEKDMVHLTRGLTEGGWESGGLIEDIEYGVA